MEIDYLSLTKGSGHLSDRSLFRQVFILTGLYSDRPLFRQFVIPTGIYSERLLFRQFRNNELNPPWVSALFLHVAIPTGRYSDRSLFAITIETCPELLCYSDRSLLRHVVTPTVCYFDMSLFRQVVIPIGLYSDSFYSDRSKLCDFKKCWVR